MIVTNIIRQQWLKGIRAQGFYKNLAVNILLGFFALYMAGILLFLGFSLDEILEGTSSDKNPMELFNSGMLYILLGGLLLRFLLQQLNTITFESYQILPIKRSALVNILLLKPLFAFVNYFQLFVTVPFAIQSVSKYYDGATAVRFIIMTVFLVWFNSLTAALLKRRFGSDFKTFIVFVAIIALVVALEVLKVFSFSELSESIFNFTVLNPVGLLIPLAAVICSYLLNRLFFSKNYYAENFNKKNKTEKILGGDIAFLNRFGLIGDLISNEIRLILRHKRTKSILYMSGFFLFYGLIFYTNNAYQDRESFLFFVAMFMTGLLMLMFGQWLLSWDSNYFDCLMTKNIPVRTYLSANYYLMIAFNILCFLLTIPYFYFGTKIIYMHIAAFIFNSGVNVYLLLFLATFNTRRIDLSRSSAMNYQGTTYKSFLIVLPIMFIPMILVGVLSTFFSMAVALWVLVILGIAGILLHKQLMNLCVWQFNRRKYALAEGFRENE